MDPESTDNLDQFLEDKRAKREKNRMQPEKAAGIKYKQYENEIDRTKRDEDKMELMTQFMLDPTSSATKLLEKRREMYELQEALQKDKEKFHEKETQFKKTEEQLRNKDEEFHKKICEYYMMTFEKKQSDAHQNNDKIDTETRNKKRMESEISELNKKNEELKKDLQKLKIIQDKLKSYETFLNQVKAKHPENFSDIEKVIEKYNILKEKHDEIDNETRDAQRKKETEKKDFRDKKSLLEVRINKIVTNIQNLQNQLKNLKEEKKNLENEVSLMETNSNTVVSSLEMILLAIDNIYNKCSADKGPDKNWTQHGDAKEFEKYNKEDPDKKRLYHQRVQEAKVKIKYINEYIIDYENITRDYLEKKNRREVK